MDDVAIRPTIYHLAKTKAVSYLLEQPGCLLIRGEDRIPFLQRQSTNDLQDLSPGSAVITVLTSPTARILDVLTVFFQDQPDLLPVLTVLTLPGRGGQTDKYLRNRIFFMDKVQVENLSPGYAQIEVAGPQADLLLNAAGVKSLPEMDQVINSQINGIPCYILGRWVNARKGYRFLLSASEAPGILNWLSEHGIERLNSNENELLRIEAGLPGEKDELTEAYTPFEVNLHAYVSDRKGCYTGQEVLARQKTYDKVTKKLAGLKTTTAVSRGAAVFAEGNPIGTVTSAAISPQFGPIALAILRRPYFEPHTSLTVETPHGKFSARVVELPFRFEE